MAASAPTIITDSGEVISVLFPKISDDEFVYQTEIVYLDTIGNIYQRISVDLQISKPSDAELLIVGDEFILFWVDLYQLKLSHLMMQGK